MLIFIENTPRAYAWGSQSALPELLGQAPTGEPQAELWFGDHPGAPASVAKARPTPQTLIELIESDPEQYGVDGAHLPFLLKVLGIGAPLSLQVHPDKQQAEAGFAREEASGVPREAAERNYGDPNHKPELLVALGEVTALCGFRPLAEVRADLLALAAAAPREADREALRDVASRCAEEGAAAGGERVGGEDLGAAARHSLLAWAFEEPAAARRATEAIAAALSLGAVPGLGELPGLGEDRARSLRDLTAAHPADVGVLLSLLLHLVTLRPGEAVYLGARHLHAYLSGVAVEVMAASDNVLRAGLTPKHIDPSEVLRIVDPHTLDSPRLEPRVVAPGLVEWQPPVTDFKLLRARLRGEPGDEPYAAACPEGQGVLDELGGSAETVHIEVPYPTVLVVVSGRARIERLDVEFAEVASVARGQSLYVSAGEAIELSGAAEVFLATVGEEWSRVS